MRTIIFRSAVLAVALGAGVLHWGCNEGTVGYLAEPGSTVALSSVPALTKVTSATVALMTTSVARGSVPGNNIQVLLTCNKCDLYDKIDTVDEVIPDLAFLQLMGDYYFIATSGDGTYKFAVLLPRPTDTGVTSYVATVGADITVAATTRTIAVSE